MDEEGSLDDEERNLLNLKSRAFSGLRMGQEDPFYSLVFTVLMKVTRQGF